MSKQPKRAAVLMDSAAVESPLADKPETVSGLQEAGHLLEDLESAIRTAQARGDHAAHAALSELHVAAGLLQAKAATRVRELAGSDAELAKKVLALL